MDLPDLLLTYLPAWCWWKLALVCSSVLPTHTKFQQSEPLLCNSKHVTQDESQAASNIDLCQSPSQVTPKQIHAVGSFRHQNRILLVPQAAYPEGDLGRQQTPLQQIPLCIVSTSQQLVHCGQGSSSQSAS